MVCPQGNACICDAYASQTHERTRGAMPPDCGQERGTHGAQQHIGGERAPVKKGNHQRPAQAHVLKRHCLRRFAHVLATCWTRGGMHAKVRDCVQQQCARPVCALNLGTPAAHAHLALGAAACFGTAPRNRPRLCYSRMHLLWSSWLSTSTAQGSSGAAPSCVCAQVPCTHVFPQPHHLCTTCTPWAARAWSQDGAAAPRTAGVCADAGPAPVATVTTANAFSAATGGRAPAAPLRPRACSTCAPGAAGRTRAPAHQKHPLQMTMRCDILCFVSSSAASRHWCGSVTYVTRPWVCAEQAGLPCDRISAVVDDGTFTMAVACRGAAP
jgi:hypothetical protein